MKKEEAVKLIKEIKWETEEIIHASECGDYDMVDVYVIDGGVIWDYIVYRDGTVRKSLMLPGESHEVRRRPSYEYDNE